MAGTIASTKGTQAAGLVVLLLLLSCTPGWNDPLKPSKDFPCGPSGVVCLTQRMCCPPGNTCGGEPDSVGCPAGMCCYIGTDGMARGDAGTP